jgi:hypothetical protein
VRDAVAHRDGADRDRQIGIAREVEPADDTAVDAALRRLELIDDI